MNNDKFWGLFFMLSTIIGLLILILFAIETEGICVK